MMREKCILLKVGRHFNPAESTGHGKFMLGENAMKVVSQKKGSRKTRTSSVRLLCLKIFSWG